MKPIAVAIHAMLGLALATGCTTPGPAAPQVKPVEIVRHGGGGADGYVQLGRFFQAQGRIAPAIDAYRKALALDGGLIEVRSDLGTLYVAIGEFDKAFVEFKEAIESDPRSARFRNNLGYAYYLGRRYAEAVATLEQAAALDPVNARTWNNLGMALAQLGETERSAAAFSRATALAAAPTTPVVAAVTPPAARSASQGTPTDAGAGRVPAVVESTPWTPIVGVTMAPALSAPSSPLAAALANPVGGPATTLAIGTIEAIRPPSITRIDEPAIALERFEAGAWNQNGIPDVRVTAEVARAPVPTAPGQEVIVAEVPSGGVVSVLGPNVVELKWTTTAVVVRPASASDVAPPGPVRLEVSNGNGVTGMARRVGGLLAAVGVPAARITNQKPFTQASTEIQYRAGYGSAAASLGARIPNQPALNETDRLRPGTDVRLVLGHDLPRNVALVDPAKEATRTATGASGDALRGK